MTFDLIGVCFLRHDVALARVAWLLTGDVRTKKPRTGMFLFVVVENNGKWAIAAARIQRLTGRCTEPESLLITYSMVPVFHEPSSFHFQ